MEMALSLKNQSIETSGLPKDFREALSEYVWNGFEANATEVKISFVSNITGEGVDSICVEDNGEGINYKTLADTFGSFLVSQKNSFVIKEKRKSNKGKGRFAYNLFAGLAKWDTSYNDEGVIKEFTITSASSTKQNISYDEPKKSGMTSTGTKVTFHNIIGITSNQLEFNEIEGYFLLEFSWFLYLHKKQNYKLIVNGCELDYHKHINTHLSQSRNCIISNKKFEINLIVWNNKIKEKFCCYFLNEQGGLCNSYTTTFNRNTVDFNHSVFICSDFFSGYNDISFDENSQLEIGKDDNYYFVIRELKKEVQKLVGQQLSVFMAEKADEEIEKMIMVRKTFPIFSDDPYGQLRKRDLIRVTKEIYCTEPKIFYKLSDVQEKSLLAFLNLLLSSEERENLLSIIEQVVTLSTEQRSKFADLLKKTKLENILDTICFVENRYKIIEILKTIIFDLDNFANERNHIQKIVEQHYWLFGEQYNLVCADVPMHKALESYKNILYGVNKPEEGLCPDEEENRRMDIFLSGSRKVENHFGHYQEENLVIELKAPKVPLSIKVTRQIEDYMRFICRQPQFKSIQRRWKFIAVCKEVDDEVKALYKAFEHLGKPGLICLVDDFEVYAICWDDIFTSFKIKHDFILDKLKFDRETLSQELLGVEQNRESVNLLTSIAIAK